VTAATNQPEHVPDHGRNASINILEDHGPPQFPNLSHYLHDAGLNPWLQPCSVSCTRATLVILFIQLLVGLYVALMCIVYKTLVDFRVNIMLIVLLAFW